MVPKQIEKLLRQSLVSLNGKTKLWKSAFRVFTHKGLEHDAAEQQVYHSLIGYSQSDMYTFTNTCKNIFNTNYAQWEVFLLTILHMGLQAPPSTLVAHLNKHLTQFKSELQKTPKPDDFDLDAFIDEINAVTMMVCRCGQKFGDDVYDCGCEEKCELPFCNRYIVPCFQCSQSHHLCEDCEQLCECTQEDIDAYDSYMGCCDVCNGFNCNCEDYM